MNYTTRQGSWKSNPWQKTWAKTLFKRSREEKIIRNVETAAIGYSKSRAEIMANAEKTIRKKAEKMSNAEDTNKKKGGLRKNKITHGWFDSFMKWQPYLSLHKGDRMDAVTSAAINHYFDLLKDVLEIIS